MVKKYGYLIIHGIWIFHIEYKNPVVVGVGQWSFEVIRGQTLKPLNIISQDRTHGYFSVWCMGCITLSTTVPCIFYGGGVYRHIQLTDLHLLCHSV